MNSRHNPRVLGCGPTPTPMPLSTASAPAIGFITYKPVAGFYDRVALALREQLHVYIVDNSPDTTDAARLVAMLAADQGQRLHYMTPGRNAGLGTGLACLCATAAAHGHQELLFFDQDTSFTTETLHHMQAFVAGPLAALRSTHAAVVFRGADPRLTAGTVHDTLLAISSGMLVVLANARRMGWHDHSFFVDGVDYEFCLNARAHGLRIGICPGAPGFDHESEQPDVPKRFLGRVWRLRRYALRRIVDSLSAYLRLALRSAGRLDATAFATVMRSASIFVLGQLLARVPLRRAD